MVLICKWVKSQGVHQICHLLLLLRVQLVRMVQKLIIINIHHLAFIAIMDILPILLCELLAFDLCTWKCIRFWSYFRQLQCIGADWEYNMYINFLSQYLYNSKWISLSSYEWKRVRSLIGNWHSNRPLNKFIWHSFLSFVSFDIFMSVGIEYFKLVIKGKIGHCLMKSFFLIDWSK